MNMKCLKLCFCVALIAILTACSNDNDNLEKMIPSDATGVVSFDVPEILKKSGINNDGKLVVPAQLKSIVESNDGSILCEIISDLPESGINVDDKVYAYFAQKTFGTVLLVSLDDDNATKKLIEKRTGSTFKTINDVDCISLGDYVYAVNDGVLLIARVNINVDINKAAKTALGIMSKTHKSIISDGDIKDCLHSKSDINAYFDIKGLNAMLRGNKTTRDLMSKVPLISIFTESDIKAMTFNITLDKTTASVKSKIKVDDNSDYVQLLDATLSKPSNSFLKAIPNSMKYIFSISVKGNNFVKLQQMQQVIKMLKNLPYLGRLDFASIIAAINGPLAVGLAPDPVFEGEWNMVIAAKTDNPALILKHVSSFASSMGQSPEIRDGEYIYEYNNKQINVGVVDGVLYIKMLDYEQTEGYAYDIPAVRDLFAKSPIGIFVQTKADSVNGYFSYGMLNNTDGDGSFYTDKGNNNATLALLKVLCAIKPASQYDDEEGESTSYMSSAIDQMQPVY